MLTAFKLLAPLKVLRGTWLDVFGHTEERQQERALIKEYQSSVEEIILELGRSAPSKVGSERYQLAVAIARIPEQIRGFGHVKERHLLAARQNWIAYMAQFRHPQGFKAAA